MPLAAAAAAAAVPACRTPQEFAAGHPVGSLNIPFMLSTPEGVSLCLVLLLWHALDSSLSLSRHTLTHRFAAQHCCHFTLLA